MMTTPRANRRTAFGVRALGVCLLLGALAAVVPAAPAAGVTSAQIDQAKDNLQRLEEAIEANEKLLDEAQRKWADTFLAVSQALGEWQVVTGELIRLREQLEIVESRYNERVALLEGRAREAYMGGTGSSIEFLLGAATLGDLNDRLEFVDQLAASDADIAAEVATLRGELKVEEADLQRLQAKEEEAVDELADRRAALDAAFAEQQAIVDEIERQRDAAEQELERLQKQQGDQALPAFEGELAGGVFKVCPVGDPHGFGDDFGAPRYSGGYHAHEGVDIFAPEGTPVYATFDGVAEDAANSLGGNAVIVRGGPGYTYNAHLSRYGKLGRVQVGDVIGFVGNTGNAISTPPHNHFEFHPREMPTDWPESGYGYSIVDDAVNPHPLLEQVC